MFGISVSPNSVEIENSGVEEIENLNLNELEKRINHHIYEAGNFYKNSTEERKNVIKKFQKHTYLAYINEVINNNYTPLNDEELKRFLMQYDQKFKRPIKALLIEYYKVLYNPDLKFEGFLLEQLGFKPCKYCEKDVLINKFELF